MTQVRWTGLLLLSILLVGLPFVHAAVDDDDDPVKAALKELNDFIGMYKGTAGPDKTSAPSTWAEGLSFGWKFTKDKAPSLSVEFEKGKYFEKGELTYVPAKKKYVLTLSFKPSKSNMTFEGEFKKGYLTLDAVDTKSGDTHRLTMSSNNDGARLILKYELKKKGSALFTKVYDVAQKKEGIDLAGGKKPECIVTGGLGTIAVSYGGKTYYVCCSGCRDEFNANPEKFVKAAEKKK